MLSKRLQTVADFVPTGAKIADIGTDHAYLLIALAKQGRIEKAIGSEIAQGPFENAVKNIEEANLTDVIEMRLGDGLEQIKIEDKLDTISINGMGGKTIVNILATAYREQKLPTYLILQPNTDEWQVRFWLNEHHYQLVAEAIVEDNGEVYEIISAKKEEQKEKLTHAEIRFGKYLLKARSKLFIEKYQILAKRYRQILHNIPKNSPKQRYIEEHLNEIEEILNEH